MRYIALYQRSGPTRVQPVEMMEFKTDVANREHADMEAQEFFAKHTWSRHETVSYVIVPVDEAHNYAIQLQQQDALWRLAIIEGKETPL